MPMLEELGMRQRSKTGYSESIWVPFFRRCRVSENQVEITPPVIFGRGYVFDRARQMVTVRRCLLRRTLSEEEIPFSEVSVRLSTRSVEVNVGWQERHIVWKTRYFIEMTVPHGALSVFQNWKLDEPGRVDFILAAIQRLGIRNSQRR